MFKEKPDKNDEPRVLIESCSPTCNLQAFVEEDDRCAYFYMISPVSENPVVSVCWIRNYVKAQQDKDMESMRKGRAPVLEAKLCCHPNGAERLDPAKLQIVWFEEGDGAGLLYEDELICVIPGWADHRCRGYSKDCKDISDLAWPLRSENILFDRVYKAKEFWDNWNENSWGIIQKEFLEAITSSIGEYTKYYAIDGGNWPPKAMVRIEKDNITYLVTLGVSIVPQPKVEQYLEEPDLHRRFEFAFAIETDLLKRNESGILRYISAQTGLPWAYQTWLGHGHTIPCDQIWPDEREFSSVLLLNSNSRDDLPRINFPQYRGDRVNLLWIVPITEEERAFAQSNSSDKLLEKHDESNPIWLFNRKAKFAKIHTV